MAVVQLRTSLIVLMILYVLAAIFGFLASIPMIWHVSPKSECLLFSYKQGDEFHYGNYASCNVVGYVFLFAIVGAVYLFIKCFMDLKKMSGHAMHGPYVPEKIGKQIVLVHCVVLAVVLTLCAILTSGYAMACSNLRTGVSSTVQQKLNVNPYDTRGEEIQTRFEDDYKFHRYTNRYGNAFGSEFYTITITCRALLTDPEIHQKLHDTHYAKQSRYYGYWYRQDIYSFDSQYEASKTNAMVEASMSGAWICLLFWLIGLVIIILQRHFIDKKRIEQDRISMHSTMMGSAYHDNGSMVGSQFRKDGSLISGRGSSFQRGGSRGSDRSIKSSRRDIDDLALGNILKNPSTPSMANSYSQPQFSNIMQQSNNTQYMGQPGGQSLHSSRETGYISDGLTGYPQQSMPNSSMPYYPAGSQPYMPNTSFTRQYPAGQSIPVKTTADATYLSRDEVETEIF